MDVPVDEKNTGPHCERLDAREGARHAGRPPGDCDTNVHEFEEIAGSAFLNVGVL